MSTPHQDTIERYFAGWNEHDGNAIVATFAPGGTYEDPNTGGPLEGAAIAAYAGRAFGMWPDVNFEITGAHCAGEDEAGRPVMATQWIMRGTNTGPLPGGMPPTGREIAVPGADFITVSEAGIHSVRGYFSPGDSMRQMGLDVIVQPKTLGPFTFGTSVHVSNEPGKEPGAVGLTWIKAKDLADMEKIRAGARATIMEMTEAPGFVGVTTGNTQGHMFTVSMWETVKDMQTAMRGPAHAEALRGVREEGVGKAFFTSAWKPDYFNMMMVRCPACGTNNQTQTDGGSCACGEPLPAEPPAW